MGGGVRVLSLGGSAKGRGEDEGDKVVRHAAHLELDAVEGFRCRLRLGFWCFGEAVALLFGVAVFVLVVSFVFVVVFTGITSAFTLIFFLVLLWSFAESLGLVASVLQAVLGDAGDVLVLVVLEDSIDVLVVVVFILIGIMVMIGGSWKRRFHLLRLKSDKVMWLATLQVKRSRATCVVGVLKHKNQRSGCDVAQKTKVRFEELPRSPHPLHHLRPPLSHLNTHSAAWRNP